MFKFSGVLMTKVSFGETGLIDFHKAEAGVS